MEARRWRRGWRGRAATADAALLPSLTVSDGTADAPNATAHAMGWRGDGGEAGEAADANAAFPPPLAVSGGAANAFTTTQQQQPNSYHMMAVGYADDL